MPYFKISIRGSKKQRSGTLTRVLRAGCGSTCLAFPVFLFFHRYVDIFRTGSVPHPAQLRCAGAFILSYSGPENREPSAGLYRPDHVPVDQY